MKPYGDFPANVLTWGYAASHLFSYYLLLQGYELLHQMEPYINQVYSIKIFLVILVVDSLIAGIENK